MWRCRNRRSTNSLKVFCVCGNDVEGVGERTWCLGLPTATNGHMNRIRFACDWDLGWLRFSYAFVGISWRKCIGKALAVQLYKSLFNNLDTSVQNMLIRLYISGVHTKSNVAASWLKVLEFITLASLPCKLILVNTSSAFSRPRKHMFRSCSYFRHGAAMGGNLWNKTGK